ncbi:MAG TPA: PTS sugar transporter subunit IIA [bacterium]|nr:PTS sugar transporter subunit IIA [bacterium]
MQILDFLAADAIKLNLESKTKKDAIKELVELLVKSGKVKDKKKMLQTLMEREELGSTGIGQGIAIPHGKSDTVSDLSAAFGVSQEGISFDALDGEPVNLFFLLVAPEGAAGAHLKALARISSLLKDKFFRKSLLSAKSPDEVIKIIQEEEKLKH